MQETIINKYLLIFTFTVALIALAILLLIFLKDKLCPRTNIYAKHSPLQHNELSEILHETPNKILLRSDGVIPIDLPDLDYIDERSIHLVSPTIVVHSPKSSLCIYGINYELNDGVFIFDEKLYFNYDQLFNDSDITIDEFEIAAKPLCDKMENDTNGNENVTHYYGAWVRTKENTYKDMFMGCCESCQVLNEIQWLIKLKVQLIARSQFGFMRQDMLLYREKMNSYFDTFYFMYQQNLITVPACETSTYDLVRTVFPKYCVQYFQRLGKFAITYHCASTSRKPDTVCLVYVLSTKYYGYECYCYGSRIPHCQERIRNSVMTGSSISTFRGRKMACIIDEDSFDNSSKVNYSTGGIEFKGDVHNLMHHMGREFCELHLKLDDSKQTNVSFNSDHIMKRHAILYQKAAEITRKADIIKRADVKSIPNLCEYNNEYQYFLHDYFYPSYPNATHSCLLHFVSKNALRDMNLYLPGENSVVFFLPGSAIQPIDFSYALLEPNECDYIDVDLKYDYLRTRCYYESTALLKYFNTRFMPMRLFACKCVTKPGETPCDNILKQSIAEKAQASNRKYYCAVYNNQNTVMFNEKPQLKVNDLSPYCTTMIDFKTIGNS